MFGGFRNFPMWSPAIAFSLLCVAGLTQAQTPGGVFPAVPNFLAVNFGGRFVNQGDNIDMNSTSCCVLVAV